MKNLRYFVIIFLFLSSCARSPKFDPQDREKITAFFEELLLEHGGAYTLFGSKPMTEEQLLDFSEEAKLEMQAYLKEHPEVDSMEVDRRLEEGWEAWKMNPSALSQNFILTEMDFGTYRTLIFVNVGNTVSKLREYYMDFKQVLGCDFDPVELVEQLRRGEKVLWGKVLSDYKTVGLLYGYGYKNSSLFEKRARGELGDLDLHKPSENTNSRVKVECYLNKKPFRIPIFVMIDEPESEFLVAKYKKERERIKNLYENRNFLEVTLDQLKKA